MNLPELNLSNLNSRQRRIQLVDAAQRLNLSTSAALALARETETSLDQYTVGSALKPARSATVRQELERLLELANRAKRAKSYAAARKMEQFARSMSAKAWLYCLSEKNTTGSVLDEALNTDPVEPNQTISRKRDYSDRAAAVIRIAEDSLQRVPSDRGAKTRDEATRRLIIALICLFEDHTRRTARLRSSGIANRDSFTAFLLTAAALANPPLSRSKALDYAKEALSYGQPNARAEFMTLEELNNIMESN